MSPTSSFIPRQTLISTPPSGAHSRIYLTDEGVEVETTPAAAVHSRKQSEPSSTTRLFPFLSILSVSLAPRFTLIIHALLPSPSSSKKKPSTAPLKLTTLKIHVTGFHDLEDVVDSGAEPRSRGATPAERSDAFKKSVERWCRKAEEKAYAGCKRKRRLHVIVNPAGGKGFAKRVWEETVKPIFELAGADFVVSFTGPPSSPTNASALARSHPSETYDALVALSGDGIVHELLNGLATHGTGRAREVLRQTPIVHVPCGSGNALATSLYGPEKVTDVRWAALTALKGTPLPFDLCSLTQPSTGSTRIMSFVSQAFGLMADLDLGTEHLRWMGDSRFTYGYIKGALSRASYPCTLSILLPPGPSTQLAIARTHNLSVAGSYPAAIYPPPTDTPQEGEGEEVGLPTLQYGTAGESKILTLEEGEREGTAWTKLPSQEEMARLAEVEGTEPEWLHLDLEKSGVFFAYGGKVPFVSRDAMLFPAADPNDGLIDLVLVEPMGPLEALSAMDGADRGSLFSHPRVLYLKALSYRLSFPPSSAPSKKEGYISIDGERVKYEGFQVEVHKGLARVMSLTGRWEGRRKIEGFE